MPLGDTLTDPELLLRDAVSGVMVAAYSRAISLSVHVDNRLPARIAPEAANLPAFLRRGLSRTVDAGHTGKIALALWLDDAAPRGGRALLEVCRARSAEGPAVAALADIWTLPLDGATARPRIGRDDAVAESVLIPLGFTSAAGAQSCGARWGTVFRGRRLLHARRVLFDRQRLLRSMADIGAEITFAPDPDGALAALTEAAADGRPFDVVAVDGNMESGSAVALARRIRAAPALAGIRIVLSSALRGERLPDEDARLFDVLPWAAAPWRRLLDAIYDLLRREAGFAEGPRPEPAPIPPGRGAAVPALKGRRILVAEDVATNQVLLRAVLAHTGAAIEVVADGDEAVARHGEEPADLIVMDLQMPGTGGIAALRAVRAMGGAAGAVPVVALTAHARSSDRRHALDAGMDAYLAKPIVVEEFYDVLRRLLPPPTTA